MRGAGGGVSGLWAGAEVGGAFMIPIRPHGRLLGMLEIGRRDVFRVREIAEVELLVDALVNKIETLGWR